MKTVLINCRQHELNRERLGFYTALKRGKSWYARRLLPQAFQDADAIVTVSIGSRLAARR